MTMLLINTIRPLLLIACCFTALLASAQQVTGVWKGKIDRKNVEVKIIQKGDSLTGTSYYYESSNNYRRYSIKGYFDPNTNSVVWWDDQLLENKGGNAGKNPQLSVADFNCPGGGEMYLDGKSAPKQDREDPKASVHLTKVPGASFPDEWDFVIDNYTVGANDPEIIDSVQLISYGPVKEAEVIPERRQEVSQPAIVKKPEEKIEAKIEPVTIEEKFKNREKIFTKEIPISGDSIELRFYDNAEIDGDSISLFLNDKLLFSHVRLTDKAYTVKLSVKEMNETNELTMVAENLGSIPPNTSYMIAIVGDKRYDARLASTENSSAMIRLRKPTNF